MSEQLEQLKQAQAARRKMLEKWRMERVIKLPELLPVSKLQVWIRDVTMTDLMFTGKLPEPMLELMEQAKLAGKAEMNLKEVARNGAEFSVMLDALVTIAVMEPPIAEEADEDHISVHELNGDDKMTIYNYMNREERNLKPFRDTGEPMAAIQPSSELSPEAEPGDGDGNGYRTVGVGRVGADGGQAGGEGIGGGEGPVLGKADSIRQTQHLPAATGTATNEDTG